MTWADKEKKLLVQLIGEGKSTFSQMAVAINRECGTAYSRNAVIGRAHRCGFTNPKQLPKLSAAARIERIREQNRARKRAARFKEKQEAPKVIDFHCEAVEPRHVSLLELGTGECHYPYGIQDYTFCGNDAYPGRPYCPAHLKLCEPSFFLDRRSTAA